MSAGLYTGFESGITADRFAGEQIDLVLGGQPVRLEGRLVRVGSATAQLTDREHALLSALLDSPGAVHSKRDLLRRVWNGTASDEHLVEVTVARLRKRLGVAGAGIETVMRRGYRASAAPVVE